MNDITKALVKRLEEKLNYKDELVYVDFWNRLCTVEHNYPIIGIKGEVNFVSWHNAKKIHEYFKFDGILDVYIETEEQAKEFEQIVLIHFLIDQTDVPEVVKETSKTTGTKLKVERSNMNGSFLNVRKDDENNILRFQDKNGKISTLDLMKLNKYSKEVLEQIIIDLCELKMHGSYADTTLKLQLQTITMLQNELILRKLGEL